MQTADALLSKISRNPDSVTCTPVLNRHRSGYAVNMKWNVSKELEIHVDLDDYRSDGVAFVQLLQIRVIRKKWWNLVSTTVTIDRNSINPYDLKLIENTLVQYHPKNNVWYDEPKYTDLRSII